LIIDVLVTRRQLATHRSGRAEQLARERFHLRDAIDVVAERSRRAVGGIGTCQSAPLDLRTNFVAEGRGVVNALVQDAE
jgi:hypothetical protein